jgi:hypothetical protein
MARPIGIHERFRRCGRPGCGISFPIAKRTSKQIYCSNTCAAYMRERARRDRLDEVQIQVIPPGDTVPVKRRTT